MYYFVIDIHHFKLFSTVEPELSEKLFSSIENIGAKWGLNLCERSQVLIYAYSLKEPEDFTPLQKILTILHNILLSYSDSIPGHSILLESQDTFNPKILSSLLLRIRNRRAYYLGPNAGRIMSMWSEWKEEDGLWIKHEPKNKDKFDIARFTLEQHFFTGFFNRISDIINGFAEPQEMHIHGEEINGLHLIGNILVQQLTVENARGKVIFSVLYPEDDIFNAIIRSISLENSDWILQNLNPVEAQIWEQKHVIFEYFQPQPKSGNFATVKGINREVIILLHLYLKAYSQWSYSFGSLPIIIFYLKRELIDIEITIIRQLLNNGKNIWNLHPIFIGESEHMPKKAIALRKGSYPLNNFSQLELQNICAQNKIENAQEIRDLSESKGIPLYYLLHHSDYFFNSNRELLQYDSRTSAQKIIQRSLYLLSEFAREMLYLLSLVGIFCTREQIFTIFKIRGKTQLEIITAYNELKVSGFIMYETLNYIPFAQEISRLNLTFVNTGLVQDCIHFMLDPDQGFRLQPGLINFIIRNSSTPIYIRPVYNYLQSLISLQMYNRVEREKSYFRPSHIEILNLVDAQLAFEYGSFTESLIPLAFSGDDYWKAEWLVLQSKYYAQTGRMKDALQSCKSAIILFQSSQEFESLARAHNVFGIIYHHFGKHKDAQYYFASTSHGPLSKGVYNIALAEFLYAISCFLQSKFSTVKKILDPVEGLLRKLHQKAFIRLGVFAQFLLARTHFAIGEYQIALSLLLEQLNSIDAKSDDTIHELYFAWIARCYIYLGKFKAGQIIIDRLEPTIENQLFKAEAYILRNDFDDAMDILRKDISVSKKAVSINPLFPWEHGFSWIEDTLERDNTENSVLDNLKLGMKAYILGNNEYLVDSNELFYELYHEKKIPVHDPQFSTILYWYAEVLERSNEGQKSEDMLTILALAVKSLQERASNIEEPADKRSFLRNVYWNNHLFETARSYNLLLDQ